MSPCAPASRHAIHDDRQGTWANRREVLRGSVLRILLAAGCLLGGVPAAEADPGPAAARASVDALHRELRGRFSNQHGLLNDFTAADGTVLVPTPEECRAAKPNGVAWCSPMANSCFFTGLWLAALVDRFEATGDPGVAERARAAAAGLLLVASVGEHPAFIARGVSTDGRGHPPTGSDDQTLPWFYGLWRYLGSGIPRGEERAQLVAAVARVGGALRDGNWRIPSDPPALGPRGDFVASTPVIAPRLLFMLRALHQITGDDSWLALYRTMRDGSAGPGSPTRLQVCAEGDLIGEYASPKWDYHQLWTKGHSVACLAALARFEEDPAIAARYREGLMRVAIFAAGRIAKGGWDPAAVPVFQDDWRQLLPLWRPQPTMAEINAVANAQVKEWDRISPRKGYELLQMAEPLFACWIVTLSGDEALVRANAPAIRAALCRYPWKDLRYCTGFAGELAWWQGRRWLE